LGVWDEKPPVRQPEVRWTSGWTPVRPSVPAVPNGGTAVRDDRAAEAMRRGHNPFTRSRYEWASSRGPFVLGWARGTRSHSGSINSSQANGCPYDCEHSLLAGRLPDGACSCFLCEVRTRAGSTTQCRSRVKFAGSGPVPRERIKGEILYHRSDNPAPAVGRQTRNRGPLHA